MEAKKSGIENLTNDIIFQVLLRLPLRSLCACKCVSKQWRNLVRDPYFSALHSYQSKKKPLMLLLNDRFAFDDNLSGFFDITLINPLITSAKEYFRINVPVDGDDDYRILYCSGLLVFFGDYGSIHTFNPSSREMVAVYNDNIFRKINRKSKFLDRRASFNRSRAYTGFGYLPSKSQYKIVEFMRISPSQTGQILVRKTKALVVTLSSSGMIGTWKILPVDFLDFYLSEAKEIFRPICASGILYWLVWRTYPDVDESYKILMFNLESEEFQLMLSPFHHSKHDNNIFLVELRERVCLVEMLHGEPLLNIWEFEDKKENEIWTKLYTINYSSLYGNDRKLPLIKECPKLIIPLQIVNDDEEVGEEKILIMLNEGNTRSFHKYNLKTKSFIELAKYVEDFSHAFFHDHVSLLPAPLPFII